MLGSAGERKREEGGVIILESDFGETRVCGGLGKTVVVSPP